MQKFETKLPVTLLWFFEVSNRKNSQGRNIFSLDPLGRKKPKKYWSFLSKFISLQNWLLDVFDQNLNRPLSTCRRAFNLQSSYNSSYLNSLGPQLPESAISFNFLSLFNLDFLITGLLSSRRTSFHCSRFSCQFLRVPDLLVPPRLQSTVCNFWKVTMKSWILVLASDFSLAVNGKFVLGTDFCDIHYNFLYECRLDYIYQGCSHKFPPFRSILNGAVTCFASFIGIFRALKCRNLLKVLIFHDK